MATIAELPELSEPKSDAYMHVRHGSKDYKLRLGGAMSGSNTYFGELAQADTGKLTVTSSTAESEYVTGRLYFLVSPDPIAESPTVTLNIDGLGLKNIKRFTPEGKQAVCAEELLIGPCIILMYDGTDFMLNAPNDNKIYRKKISITKEQIAASESSSVELVPALGANDVIECISAIADFTYATTRYNNVRCGVFQQGCSEMQLFSDDLLYSSSDRIVKLMPLEAGATGVQLKKGVGLYFYSSSDPGSGGEGSMDLYILYRVITLA